MERLTHRYTDGQAYVSLNMLNAVMENEAVGLPITKLAHYEDLVEKGLLVELDERPTKNTTQLFYIYDRNIWSIKFEDIGKAIKRRGITKFYTKFAEAEQALKY